ncbi:Ras guanine nucleotide exchange factor [Reticulomyxa filosa]|uniref:Ras guanine nucleotide exchange factor n=1 Tax=Reticulomyxa filosa TaxID=46433 RepID=X6N0W1_RETFI|nr:Ras guanine nucleotide exchange factor [Reticulomyxa filosa]|eukprot:ETO19716.1 Ras guanine nucleotide exchange factor [Reticulomyxa filosa]
MHRLNVYFKTKLKKTLLFALVFVNYTPVQIGQERSLMKQLRWQFKQNEQVCLSESKADNSNNNNNNNSNNSNAANNNDNDTNEKRQSRDWLVRVRLCNMVRYWIKHYWEEDFATQKDLQQQIVDFKRDIEQVCDPHKAQTLKEKLDMTVQGVNHGKLIEQTLALDPATEVAHTEQISDNTTPTDTPKTDENKQSEEKEENYRQDHVHLRWPYLENNKVTIPSGMNLMSLDPDDIAQQLTLMDFHLFQQIKARECISQSWKKKGEGKWRLASNVLRMIAQFNSVSKWAQLTVLEGKTPKERANIIKKILTMMKSLQKIRNFSTTPVMGCFVLAFFSFSSSFFSEARIANFYKHRIYLCTHKKLPRIIRKDWDEIKESFDFRMAKLKQLQEQAIAPAVPHIGLYLQILFSIDEGNEDISTKTGVNYVKMMMLYDQIEKLMQYQQGKFEITQIPQIQKLLYQEFSTQYKMSEKHVNQLADIVRNTERDK